MILQNVNSKKSIYLGFILIFLGMLSAFAPLVTDMYLPTFPTLETEFKTTVSMIQLGLTASMIGLAAGQIFFGPLSDMYGRKPILVSSLVLFCVATILCMYSGNITIFLYMRLLQGLGASGGIVLSRSVATDLYSGRELAKMMAIIGAVNGVAPVTAPVIGGSVAAFAGWQGIFCVLFFIGIVLLLMCLIFRESLPVSMRVHGSASSILKSYSILIKKRDFTYYVLSFAMSQGVLFAYISAAPFIMQHDFGFSEMKFSIIFGINALGIGVGSAMSMKFNEMRKACVFGAAGMLVTAVAMLVFNILTQSFWTYEICAWLMLFFMGFVFTGATTVAMDRGREYIGAASATVGASGFLAGGLVSPLVGIGNTMVMCPAVCAACAVLSLVMSRSGYRK